MGLVSLCLLVLLLGVFTSLVNSRLLAVQLLGRHGTRYSGWCAGACFECGAQLMAGFVTCVVCLPQGSESRSPSYMSPISSTLTVFALDRLSVSDNSACIVTFVAQSFASVCGVRLRTGRITMSQQRP
jgi:hypothetical protein